MKQQQNSHIGIIYVTHLREVYRPFTLTNFQIYRFDMLKEKR